VLAAARGAFALLGAILALSVISVDGQADDRATVAERVTRLTRGAAWRSTRAVPVAFQTHHPQGMVKIGDRLFVSSVEVTRPTRRPQGTSGRIDRDAGAGVGHLFLLDLQGKLVRGIQLGEGPIYHPGGIDHDGAHIWVPVAEYRPDSRSIVYRVDPGTLAATEVFRFPDHLGAVVVDTDDRSLHAVSWGARRFYRWALNDAGRPVDPHAPRRTANPSHYVDYQDCRYAGGHRMLCSGVSEFTAGPGGPLRLGGLELVDLTNGRPVHQVPVLLWTDSGLVMTRNPSWFEATTSGLRAYFMPEDNTSTLYVYEVEAR
jgi:hypothetical protein